MKHNVRHRNPEIYYDYIIKRHTRINPKIIKNKFLTKQLIKFNQILELPSNQNKVLGLQFLRTQFI